MTGWRGGNGRNPEQLDPALRNHFVYWFYDADGECIYVGCTRHPEKRWRQHRQNSRRIVAETARCRMAGPYSYFMARRIERAQQFDLRPKYCCIPITRYREDAPWIKHSPPTYVGGDA
jgi:predicted GIY-YIG superfamily endonuclease